MGLSSCDKKHSQLKKTVANNHAKGDTEAFPCSCHATLTLMNDFKPLVIEDTAPVEAQGTAFAQKKQGPGTVGTDAGTEWPWLVAPRMTIFILPNKHGGLLGNTSTPA